VVERAASIAETGIITVHHLPAEIYAPSLYVSSPEPQQAIESLDCREQRQQLAKDAEKVKIRHMLNTYAGNVSQVARELGVSRKTLYNKMRSYAIHN
jgi:DNA-binding NtrC family response regulator